MYDNTGQGKNNIHMAHMHIQWGVDHNSSYTLTKIVMVTCVGGNIEMYTVHLLNTVLNAVVFQIIGMTM